jgi:hypothetical protein
MPISLFSSASESTTSSKIQQSRLRSLSKFSMVHSMKLGRAMQYIFQDVPYMPPTQILRCYHPNLLPTHLLSSRVRSATLAGSAKHEMQQQKLIWLVIFNVVDEGAVALILLHLYPI